MAQFDIHRNTAARAEDFPYLLDIQSDLLDRLGTRLVVPLMPLARSNTNTSASSSRASISFAPISLAPMAAQAPAAPKPTTMTSACSCQLATSLLLIV